MKHQHRSPEAREARRRKLARKAKDAFVLPSYMEEREFYLRTGRYPTKAERRLLGVAR